MAQFYTLEEAAKILHTTPDKVREMVRQGKLRGFQDKGTLRFRANDIEELARSLGLGSDPELQLGEETPQKPASSGASKKSGGGRKPTQVKPPGSDSDVRLVVEDFALDDEPTPSKAPSKKSDKKPAKPDSGLRLLPMEEDSDVKLVPEEEPAAPPSGTSRKNAGSKTPSDSDIRLTIEDGSDPGAEPQVTEEIDLDEEELRAASASARQKKKKGSDKLPTTSPFELSEEEPAPKSKKASTPSKKPDSDKKRKPVNLSLDDDDSDEIGLGMEPADPADSGINLGDPADSGPSLEDAGKDEDGSSDMELSLDSGKSSSKSGKKGAKEDSSSEFELALDDDEAPADGGSSEFELTLDEDGSGKQPDSDSEFELTLDEDDADVDLSPVDEGDEKDIFETNLDVPALDDESSSEAVAMDATEEVDSSSEFELDLDDGGEGDEDSESQVVPLDEDEADEADETAAATAKKRGGSGRLKGRSLSEAAFGDEEDTERGFDEDEDEDEDERPAAAAAGTVPWGPMPALMLLPTVLVLFVVALMSYELVRNMWGYQKGTPVSKMIIKPIAEMIGDKLPD